MQFVGRVVSTVTEFYKDINPATLSGAIDVVVVEQPDKELRCSPFHVRFGKLKLLRPQEKVVEVRVNGELTDLQMKVGEAGEAFFVNETDDPVPSEYATSPIPLPQQAEMDIEPLNLNDDTYSDNIDYASAHGSVDEFFPKKGFGSSKKTSIMSEQINSSKPIYIKPIIKKTCYQPFQRIRYENEEQDDMLNYHSYTQPRDRYLIDETFLSSSYPISSNYLSKPENKKFKKDIEENENPDPIPKYNDSSFNFELMKKYPDINDDFETGNLTNEILTQEPQEFVNTDIKEKQWSWRWGALPTKNMSYRPSVDTLELSKNTKHEISNLKAYIENRNRLLSRNKTLTYKEKVENYLEANQDYMMSSEEGLNSNNNNSGNNISVENEFNLNRNQNNIGTNDNSTHLFNDKEKYDSNEFGLSGLIDVFENGDIQVSNCKLNDLIKLPDDVANELFEKNLLTYERFCENPLIITKHDDLVCKINKRYFSWKVIESLMASIMFFRKPLNAKAIEKLVQDQNRNRFWRPQWWKRSTVQNNNDNNNNNNNNNNNTLDNNINNNQPVSSPSFNEYAFSPKMNEYYENNNDINNQDKLENMLYDMLSSPELRPIRHETQPVMLPSPELSPLPVKTTMSEPAHEDYNDYISSSYDRENDHDQKIVEDKDENKCHYVKYP